MYKSIVKYFTKHLTYNTQLRDTSIITHTLVYTGMHRMVGKGYNVHQLHSIISNSDINLSAQVVGTVPSIECGREVGEGNKGQTYVL